MNISDINIPSVISFNLLEHSDNVPKQKSFLYSQHKFRKTEPKIIINSNKNNNSENNNNINTEENPILSKKIIHTNNNTSVKKVSFKIKKQSSIYRNNNKNIIINTNKVSELAKKYNDMIICGNTTIITKSNYNKLIRKSSSTTNNNNKNKLKKQNSNSLKVRPTTLNIMLSKKENNYNSSVRAAIEIFEQKSNSNSPSGNTPTKLQSKFILESFISCEENTSLNLGSDIDKSTIEETAISSTNVKVLDLIEKSDTRDSNIRPHSVESNSCLTSNRVKETVEAFNLNVKTPSVFKSATNEQISNVTTPDIPIISIPAVLPQRRCDSMYETLNLRRDSQTMKARSAESIPAPNTSFLWRKKLSNGTVESCNNTVDNSENKPPDRPPKNVKITIGKKKMPLPEGETTTDEPQLIQDECGYEIIGGTPVDSEYLYQKINKNEINHQKNKGYEEITTNLSLLLTPTDNNDGYEPINNPNEENIYETLREVDQTSKLSVSGENILVKRGRELPLPPTPILKVVSNVDDITDGYESIYGTRTQQGSPSSGEDNYECVDQLRQRALDDGAASNRDSLLSVDQKSNSLYGKSMTLLSSVSGTSDWGAFSDVSSNAYSDRSDEWVDVSDIDENGTRKIIIVRDKCKNKKSEWSRHIREQWLKTHEGDTSGDHHYESLYTVGDNQNNINGCINNGSTDDLYDSFESDTESEHSFDKINDADTDVRNSRLPDPPSNNPTNQAYSIMKFAEKQMKMLKKNLTKDLSKSLRRMTKRMSTDMDFPGLTLGRKKSDQQKRPSPPPPIIIHPNHQGLYENIDKTSAERLGTEQIVDPKENLKEDRVLENDIPSKTTNISKNRETTFLKKFRRSMTLTSDAALQLTSNLSSGSSNNVSEQRSNSTFYVCDETTPDVTSRLNESMMTVGEDVSSRRSSAGSRIGTKEVKRPIEPPPPAPTDQKGVTNNKKERKTSSWYAEAGLFGASNELSSIILPKRPNTTFWYTEIGLYDPQTPTNLINNSKNDTNNLLINDIIAAVDDLKSGNDSSNDNDSGLYGGSVKSDGSSSHNGRNKASQNVHLRLLQDEPLYQFYDAALLESACYGTSSTSSTASSSEFESDNYDDVVSETNSNYNKVRPSAMELVSPKRNNNSNFTSSSFTRTLWCEIPEVVNSAVLSTLSSHQKKIQEAKFEILTSEASYLNSLNVLTNHFVRNLENCELLTNDDKDILFGKIKAVKLISEKLLLDLEKCWQDNILLHGICDVIQKHADENFSVYIPYCQNQVVLDDTLKVLRDRPGFMEILQQLELSQTCQSLTLYSFLMLPLQRVTRWPLLVDAVLKRLNQQDDEYSTCQFTLATLNKIVNQCNEAARAKERETELKKLTEQLDFQAVLPFNLVSGSRWLVRSGQVMHIQPRVDDVKLTFGKRFIKANLCLFLFNDLLCVTKEKSENSYTVIHYCPRNLVELNTSDLITSLPAGKDSSGKNLIFLTLLENQDGKTVEMMLSCTTETDKERWLEALAAPMSDDPNETLYECWDCPQVMAVHDYPAGQPDELALSKGDVINVLRKMQDGWYHGERIRDAHTGWFPANHTIEIINPHVRARNIKQRYRLLAYSENYLKLK